MEWILIYDIFPKKKNTDLIKYTWCTMIKADEVVFNVFSRTLRIL